MVGKLWSSFVSEIIKISILSSIREIRNSNLFLKEFIFKWAVISLLKFFRRRAFKSILVFFVLAVWFAFNLIHSSSDYGAVENTAAISTLFSSKHQLRIFDKDLHKVFCKIGAPLLFKCNLLPFRCWVFKIFEWSIK